MRSVSVANAKEQLPSLLAAANAGETVIVTKHGRPVAEIIAPREQDGRIGAADLAWLRAERISPVVEIDSMALIRSMRDGTDR